MRIRLPRLPAALAVAALAVVAGCGTSGAPTSPTTTAPPRRATTTTATTATTPTPRPAAAGTNVYAHDGRDALSPTVREAKHYVYVPNSDSDTVDVVDQATRRIVAHYVTGENPQHVVPAWDLKTLYVTNNAGNSLTPIDPLTGLRKAPNIPVDDPYNMYFTPDGRYAMVVAEAHQHLDFYDPHTWRLERRIPVDCAGIDHVDFAADNSYFIATCEFASRLVKVNLRTLTVTAYLPLLPGSMPQDIKLEPAGKIFYVADMMVNGVYMIDGASFRYIGFLKTGKGAHGLYPSRDARSLYVSNRGEGSISVINFATRRVIKKWRLPGGGSPDMGGVSADGSVLWLTGRYNRELYEISTRTGELYARIPVGAGPHGACVWPQPGRYSLGHTGILR